MSPVAFKISRRNVFIQKGPLRSLDDGKDLRRFNGPLAFVGQPRSERCQLSQGESRDADRETLRGPSDPQPPVLLLTV